MSTIATKRSGQALTYAAAVNSDDFVNDGATYLHVKNGGGSAITVTVAAQAPCSFGVSNAAHNYVSPSIAAGADLLMGPFNPAQFNVQNGAQAGKAVVTFSATTSVTWVPVKL